MPLDYRKGLFRLWFSVWAVTVFVICLAFGWGIVAFKIVAVFSAAIWTLWTLLIWIAAGFGKTAPPNFGRLVAILLLAALVYGGIELFERGLLADLSAAPTTTWQPPPEIAREERIQESSSLQRAREQLEKASEHADFARTRMPEILEAYPKNAKDREIDDDRARFSPRKIGEDDAKRRDRETGREFLVTCAKTWIRRKCARSLANSESDRGELYDTKAEMRARADEAERRAERKARIAREALMEQARLAREREEMATMLDLYPLYAGSENQRWCAQNHGVEFGPKNSIQREMQRECRRIRDNNRP
jgi:hypothetical protein